MEYSIGQVADKLGISIDTIRYYDKNGLLPFVQRHKNGRRFFTDDNVHLMRTIICLKNAGVSVKDIQKFIQLRLEGDQTLNQRYNLLEHHEKELINQINDLKETLSYLKYKKWYYETAKDAGTESIHFVPGSNEVKPDLAEEYIQFLKDANNFDELNKFENVRDYRNRDTKF